MRVVPKIISDLRRCCTGSRCPSVQIHAVITGGNSQDSRELRLLRLCLIAPFVSCVIEIALKVARPIGNAGVSIQSARASALVASSIIDC